MRTCGTNHHMCGPARKTRLPTRVIEVCDTGSPHVLLRAPAADMTDLYACLSHCWGAHPSTFQLTSENKHHLTNSCIPLCEMPRTFVDAVVITRKLNIPYLWIDSMCIIQDDNADWVRESLAMAEVYQNSAITIAATASADSSTGCFLDGQLHQHILLQLGRYELFVRRLPRPSGRGHGHRLCITADDEKLPLLQRGWVYQERLLSPRLIHFLENDVIWECNSSISCHCELYQPKEISGSDHDTRIAPKLNHSSSFLFGAGELHQRWLSVVEEYTPLRLTVPTDRLPALSGLAARFAAANGDNYVAGLWECTIASDLLWRVSSVPIERPTGFRAPSWSWASVTGSISYSFVTKERLKLFTSSLESKPQIRNDSSGAIGLTLSGQMAVVRSEWGGRSLASSSWNEQNFDFYPDVRISGMEMQGGSYHKQLYCFGVGEVDTKPSTVYFLVLRCLDASTQLYERVGIAECSNSDTLVPLLYSRKVITIK
jgi:Heterokaryon incompatibility protein (HET)